MSDVTETDNPHMWIDGGWKCDGGEGEGVQSSHCVPNRDLDHVHDDNRNHGNEDETCVGKDDVESDPINDLPGEPHMWKGDSLIGGEKELSSELEYIKMENRLVEKEPCGLSSDRKISLNVDDNDRERMLETDSGLSPLWNEKTNRQKPGVILLGRGNSFSLGRSEVILLHNRPKSKSTKDRKSKTRGMGSTKEGEKLVTIDERRYSVESDDVLKLDVIGGGESGDYNKTVPSPSPPPVSNGLNHPDSQQTTDWNGDESSSSFIELVPCYQHDLQDLWLKAESVMTQRKDKVRKILEEFGIGEPGGGGGEDVNDWEDVEDVEERKKEEEEVWQIIQDS